MLTVAQKAGFSMKFHLLGTALVATAIGSAAYALPAVRPELPPVAYADTETATNVPFAAWEEGLREFRFDLAFVGTASNNVEMAFGTDADGNGELSDGEIDVRVGWDCGAFFVTDNATDERVVEAAPDGAHTLSCVCELRAGRRIVRVAFTDNGLAAFCGLGDAKPTWLHSAGWNMVRLVGRGENVRAGERFSARTTPSGLVFSLW